MLFPCFGTSPRTKDKARGAAGKKQAPAWLKDSRVPAAAVMRLPAQLAWGVGAPLARLRFGLLQTLRLQKGFKATEFVSC